MNKYDPEISEDKKDSGPGAHRSATPSLPLPSLQDSADRLTQWFTPLLENEQRAETRAALNSFIKTNGLGEKLHEKLIGFSTRETTKNWLDEFWTNRFLARRDPIAINENYFFLFRHDENDRSRRAACLIAAALNYKLVLDQGQIPSAVQRSSPICMEQTRNLFSTTRIPGEKQDHLKCFEPGNPDEPSPPRHIVVFCRSNIYRFELVSIEGQPHTLNDIKNGLDEIVDASLEEQPSGRAIGHLTSLPRTDWARTRISLINGSPKNADNLKAIESALFSVHLEDESPEDNLDACNYLLRGNSGNRWFDKSLQFIVFRNGQAGINVEHAGLDRATVVDFLDYVLGIDPKGVDQYSGAIEQGAAKHQCLAFDLTPTFQKKITRTAAAYEKRKTETISRAFQFKDFDAKLLEQQQISADAFALCALQVAHFRLAEKMPAVGQNISMRHYTSGRTQNMWVTSSEMIDFVEIMEDQEQNLSEKFSALKTAIKQHEACILQCREGNLPEQHLTQLFNIYHDDPDEFHSDFLSRLTKRGNAPQDVNAALTFFKSPGWTSMKNGAINTSFLSSPNIVHQGFSPYEPKNIAAGCQLHYDMMNGYVCAEQAKEKFLGELVTNWQNAVADLQTLIRQNMPASDIEFED